MGWRETLRESNATHDQKQAIEQLVDAELRVVGGQLLLVRSINARLLGDFAEWVEKWASDLDGARSMLRGDDGGG